MPLQPNIFSLVFFVGSTGETVQGTHDIIMIWLAVYQHNLLFHKSDWYMVIPSGDHQFALVSEMSNTRSMALRLKIMLIDQRFLG